MADASEVRVVIVDDHQMFAESLSHLLSSDAELEVAGVASSAEAGLELVRRTQPDVALVDYRLPDQDGVALTGAIHEHLPDVHVVILTGLSDERVLIAAIEAGVSGFLTKDRAADDVVEAVKSAAAGEALIPPATLGRLLPRLPRSQDGVGADLTARERQLLERVAEGGTNKAIARELHLSVNTVRNYMQALLTKLGAHSKLEAVAIATRAGLLESPITR
jgi:two-component system, NarL family, response regulator DevR